MSRLYGDYEQEALFVVGGTAGKMNNVLYCRPAVYQRMFLKYIDRLRFLYFR